MEYLSGIKTRRLKHLNSLHNDNPVLYRIIKADRKEQSAIDKSGNCAKSIGRSPHKSIKPLPKFIFIGSKREESIAYRSGKEFRTSIFNPKKEAKRKIYSFLQKFQPKESNV